MPGDYLAAVAEGSDSYNQRYLFGLFAKSEFENPQISSRRITFSCLVQLRESLGSCSFAELPVPSSAH